MGDIEVCYDTYLLTLGWKMRREEALYRAGWKCQVCGISASKAELNVHHNFYGNLGNEPQEDLVVLCREDHELFHRFGKLRR
jgi:predicted HNH restriction endonuclease